MVRARVVVPVFPVTNVRLAELPVLRGVIEPREKTVALFLPRHVEEELHDGGPVPREVQFVVADRLKSTAPELVRLRAARNRDALGQALGLEDRMRVG